MNILFVDMHNGLGGHTRTATTIAQALQRRGHHVSFAVVKGSVTKVIDDADLKTYSIYPGWAGRYPALGKFIHDLHKRGEVDVVHSFSRRGVPEAAQAAKELGVPVFQTICGGRPPKTVVETKPIISLSQEIKDSLLGRTALKDGDIEVIPARLDFEALLGREKDETLAQRFREKYSLPPSSKIVLRIARVAKEYKGALLQSADAVAQLHKEGHDVRFVHIGFVPSGDEDLFREVKAHFSDINRAAGVTLAVSAQDEASHASDYIGLADVIVGLGRTAFEGMFFRKPVALVGTSGFAGLIGRNNTKQLAFYNFSGRHLKEDKSYEQSLTELTETLRELLSDEELRTRLGEFGRTYVLENLDANVAARRYEALYEAFSPTDYPSDEQLAEHLKITPRRFLKALLPKSLHRYYAKLRYSQS